jgi:hypothetical protein
MAVTAGAAGYDTSKAGNRDTDVGIAAIPNVLEIDIADRGNAMRANGLVDIKSTPSSPTSDSTKVTPD